MFLESIILPLFSYWVPLIYGDRTSTYREPFHKVELDSNLFLS